VHVVRGERDDDGRRDDDEDGERGQNPSRSCSPPDVDPGQRQEDERIDLRRDRQPEYPGAEQVAPAQEQKQREHRQERGPRVVGVERDRAEGDRRQRQQRGRHEQPSPRDPELDEHERREQDRRQPAQRHQRLEGRVVMRSPERRRRHEDRERTRRVLDEHDAVGLVPVQEALGVALVDVDVAEAGRAEQPAVRDCAGRQEDRH